MSSLTYNPSPDGYGTFEESTPLDKYKCWIEFREQALFQVEFYLSLGEEYRHMAKRYYKLLNAIEDRMRLTNFSNE